MRILAVLLGSMLALSLPRYDANQVPYRTAWGPYTVTVESVGKGDLAPQRLRILDRSGRTRIEVDDRQITDVETVPLTGRGSDDLHVTAYTGGAHCCSTDYFFSRRGGLHNVLVFGGGNDGINAIRDIDGDGRPEVLASNDVLAYVGDLAYAGSPHLPLVLKWDGRRFVDRTARFPRLVMSRVGEFRKALVDNATKSGEEADLERRYGAAGYYGCMLLLGRGTEAARWVGRYLPPGDRAWFRRYRPEAREALAATPGKIRVVQRRVYASSY